jgi:hypothetical protein
MGGMGGFGGAGGIPSDFRARLDIAQLSAALIAADPRPQNQEILKRLEEPATLSFARETRLGDVLKSIKNATKGTHKDPIPIYVDPKGLEEAEVSLEAMVRLDLEGIPLRTSLRLMLKQLGLAYCVRDGVLIISSVQGVREELAEAARELYGSGNQEIDVPMMSRMGIMGGGGAGMR